MASTRNPVDAHVGARLRQIRMMRGFSQERVARALGMTFQQIQKYETGTNRITVGRLFDLSVLLDVPVGYFYEQMPDHVAAASPAVQASTPMNGEPPQSDPFSKRENLEHELRHANSIAQSAPDTLHSCAANTYTHSCPVDTRRNFFL